VISLTDDVCGGAILDIDSVSVLDVVFMLGVVTRNCSAEIANLGAFFVTHSRSNAFLTPYVLMACKPVEARERLAVEGKSGHVESEPRIVSAPPRRKPPAEPAAWIGIIFLTI
jgi:hypothetical protein